MKTLLLNRIKKTFVTGGGVLISCSLTGFFLTVSLPSAGWEGVFLTEDCKNSLVKAFQQPLSTNHQSPFFALEEELKGIVKNSACLSEDSKAQILLRIGKGPYCTDHAVPYECLTPLEKELMHNIIIKTSDDEGEVSETALAQILFDMVFSPPVRGNF